MSKKTEAVDEHRYKDFVTKMKKTDGAGRVSRYPDFQPGKMDKSFPGFAAAASNHEMWHKKEAESAFVKRLAFPTKMSCAGHAMQIVYLSDKWEEHADFFSYIHHFDTAPEVYMDAGMIDGGDTYSTASVLGVKSVGSQDKLATPILGRVAEFTFRLHSGKPHVLVFDFPPLMVCAPDREGLVILSDQMGPIIVRGGQMEITARGIVK